MRSLRYNHIFFHRLTCLCELLLCRGKICATMRYIGAKVSEGKKKYFKDFLLWHYLLLFLPLRKAAAAEFALCQRAEESDSFIWPTTISRTIEPSEKHKVIFFFFFSWRTVCMQPSTDLFIYLFLWRVSENKICCLFLALPSACIPLSFIWAVHAEVRRSRDATWYKLVFALPCPCCLALRVQNHICF